MEVAYLWALAHRGKKAHILDLVAGHEAEKDTALCGFLPKTWWANISGGDYPDINRYTVCWKCVGEYFMITKGEGSNQQANRIARGQFV